MPQQNHSANERIDPIYVAFTANLNDIRPALWERQGLNDFEPAAEELSCLVVVLSLSSMS
jgi:hypothetical protein